MARPPAVPSRLYSGDLLRSFAGGEHRAFLANGGRPIRPRVARSLALADLRPGLRVVDVGCGRGEVALRCVRRGVRVTAVDYSTGGLALTRGAIDLASDRQRSRAALVRADATAIPVADGSADRVLLLDIVEHLHDWQLRACLAEVRRILGPDGYVVVHTLPNRWAMRFAYPWIRLLGNDLPRHARSDYERAVHVNEQDPRALGTALRRAGLEARVWVEEWSTRHAVGSSDRAYPDALRTAGYPVLRNPVLRRAARLAMFTPASCVVGNDIFALAWPPRGAGPPDHGRWRPFR